LRVTAFKSSLRVIWVTLCCGIRRLALHKSACILNRYWQDSVAALHDFWFIKYGECSTRCGSIAMLEILRGWLCCINRAIQI